MTWMTRGVTETLMRQVKDEMGGSDRAAAIVGGAFVEEQLTRVLKSRLIKDEKVTEDMLGSGRPFGDFGAKISFGYLIGLYSTRAYKELNTIRRIRNDFAHQLELHSFDRNDIRDRCENLTLSQSKAVNLTVSETIPGEHGNGVIHTLGETNEAREDELGLFDFSFETCPPSPRDRFTTACRFYITAFSILTNQNPNPSIQQPLF